MAQRFPRWKRDRLKADAARKRKARLSHVARQGNVIHANVSTNGLYRLRITR